MAGLAVDGHQFQCVVTPRDGLELQFVLAPRDAKPQVVHRERRAEKPETTVQIGRSRGLAADLPTQFTGGNLICRQTVPTRTDRHLTVH